MPWNIASVMETIRERIVRLDPEETRSLNENEQTRLSWARSAKTYADLPEIYRSFYDGMPAETKDQFPYTVISPTFRGFLHPEPEKLICRVNGSIYVLEERDGRLAKLCYPLAEINFIETGTILLHSWLTINGVDSSGRLASSTIKYNTATERLFTPFVEGFRSAVTAPAVDAGTYAEPSPFDALADVNFKFMNYGRRSVQPGEKVLQIVLQPEIRTIIFSLLGFILTRRIAPAHLTILTESELIFIRDDLSQRSQPKVPYGGVWDYVPHRKITSVSLSPKKNNLLELSIHLPKKQHLDFPFQMEKKAEVEKLRKQIAARVGA